MPQFRYALRSLSRHPALVLAAVLSIAVGIGANTVAFGLIRAVLLRPLPYRDPARIVQIWQTHPTLGNLQVTWPDYLDWRQARSFESVEAYTFQAMNKVTLLGDGPPEQLQATMISPGLLPMLGVNFVRGGNPMSGKPTEVLISEALWRRKFTSDPNIVGRTIRVPPLELTHCRRGGWTHGIPSLGRLVASHLNARAGIARDPSISSARGDRSIKARRLGRGGSGGDDVHRRGECSGPRRHQ